MAAKVYEIGDTKEVRQKLSKGYHRLYGTDIHVWSDGSLTGVKMYTFTYKYKITKGDPHWEYQGLIDYEEDEPVSETLKDVVPPQESQPWWKFWAKRIPAAKVVSG